MPSKSVSTKIKNLLGKLSRKKEDDSSLNQNISSLSVDDFAVNIMSSGITADFTKSYNTAEAERGKYVVSDTTHSTYTGYPSAGRGKYTMLTYEIQSADAVDFSQSYNTAEAERGKFVKLDLDSSSTGYPSGGRGKYAVLTYNVNSTSSGSSATELDDLTDVTITSPVTELQVLIYENGIWKNSWPEVKMIQVRNDEGYTIPAGAPLYSRGEIGGSNRVGVGIADANDSAKMPCIGLAYEEMNTTSTKDNFAVVSGVFNTPLDGGFTGLSEGDTVYVKNWTGTPTTASDVLTTTKPTDGTELVQNVGTILKTNGTIIQGILVSAIGRSNDIPNGVITTNSADADYVYIDDGNVWKKITPANLGIAQVDYGMITVNLDNGTSTIVTGTSAWAEMPYNAVIERVTILADQVGTLSGEIQKDSYSNWPPTAADSILNFGMVNVNKYEDDTPSGNMNLSAGDIMQFVVLSAADISKAVVSIKLKKELT